MQILWFKFSLDYLIKVYLVLRILSIAICKMNAQLRVFNHTVAYYRSNKQNNISVF